ncbi:energy transducer TonB [Hahella sp. NBU794]|uniref:energy transducer TonB n=1 Tax=Hahella sp. NBU794 TaxID=3422590 RepID=UPI003D6F1ED5
MSTDVSNAKYPPLLWMALVASLAAHLALVLYFNSPQPTRDRLKSTTMTVAIQAPASPTPVSAAPAQPQSQPVEPKPTPQPVLKSAPQPQPADMPEPVSQKPKVALKPVETPAPKPKPVPANKPVVKEKTPKPTQAAHKPVAQPVSQTATAKSQVTPAVSKPAQAVPTPAVAAAPVSAPVAVSAPSEPRYQLGEANTPKPEYPGLATRRGWQGTVMVELLVDALGNPVKVSIKRSSGYTVLDNQALKTLSGWRLAAADGLDRETIVVPVVFRLN